MKVIDLLNKIANGEEVPKKIKVYDDIYVYESFNKLYWNDNDRNLLDVYNGNILNYEIEIIEDTPKEEIQVLSRWYPPKEDKKIEKFKVIKDNECGNVLLDYDNKKYIISVVDAITLDKINEIIERLNSEDNE